MITVKVNSTGLNKVLAKSNTYAETEAGKLVENLLRNIVTGEPADGLAQTEGMYRVAYQNKPSKADIENDVKRLKSAFILRGKTKRLQRISAKMQEKIIQDRVDRSGHTGRSLEYPNWAQAVKGRMVSFANELTDKTIIQIQTKGRNPKAKFKSFQGGVRHFQEKLGLATNAVAKTATNARAYIKLKFTNDLKRFLR